MTAVDLYLDLLTKSLTGTLEQDEPDHDNPDIGKFVVAFTMHYMRGNAITMLPRVRLDNIRYCIEAVIADNIPGDLIETGVWRGGGSIFMRGCLSALCCADRVRSRVADSFEGLPEPDAAHSKEQEFYRSAFMQKHYKKMAASFEEVQENFRKYGLLTDQVRFLKGWFKDTLAAAPITQLSIMRLDGDYYASTMEALTALYSKLSLGGFVIIDDYGEDLWTDCRQAVDDFRRANRVFHPMTMVDSRCGFWRKSGE